MPIRIRWSKGEFLGLAFVFLGIMMLFQLLFIVHGQYITSVGSIYAIILVPVGVSLSLTFATIIVYEALAQRARTSRIRKTHGKGKMAIERPPFWKTHTFHSCVSVFVLFFLFYLAAFAVTIEYLESMQSFIIAENSGAIGTLVVVSLFESQYAPKKVTY
ncbi:MAG: hypothetical protein ACTSU5_09005 [Promethearchaeota archaeon]